MRDILLHTTFRTLQVASSHLAEAGGRTRVNIE